MARRSASFVVIKASDMSVQGRLLVDQFLLGFIGTVKAIQVEDNICLTGGADGTVHLWDLRQVEDYEERLKNDEERVRKNLDGLHMEDEEAQEIWDQALNDETEKPAEKRVPNDTPCIRVLEGHSKAVTALYYEQGCLVSSCSGL